MPMVNDTKHCYGCPAGTKNISTISPLPADGGRYFGQEVCHKF